MKLQKLYALTTFIVLISTLFVYGMEQNYDAIVAIQQAKEYNDRHPLLCLPLEVQHQIIFPCGTLITEITEDNADELTAQIKVFFRLKNVCKYFNEKLKLPWIQFDLATKNKMMQEILMLIEKYSHELYSTKNADELLTYKHAELVSSGYKRYRVVPLALVYSGACADITIADRDDLMKKYYIPNIFCTRNIVCEHGIPYQYATSCLSKAVHAQDGLAIALLLDHGADPYQLSINEHYIAVRKKNKVCAWMFNMCYRSGSWVGPICFRSPTIEIAKLFCEKVDKQKLLSEPDSRDALFELEFDCYTPEVMQFWLDYGIELRILKGRSEIYDFTIGLCIDSRITLDIFLKKAEILLKLAPDMINVKDKRDGMTVLDCIISRCEDNQILNGGFIDWTTIKVSDCEKFIAFFREYGAKTAQELREQKA